MCFHILMGQRPLSELVIGNLTLFWYWWWWWQQWGWWWHWKWWQWHKRLRFQQGPSCFKLWGGSGWLAMSCLMPRAPSCLLLFNAIQWSWWWRAGWGWWVKAQWLPQWDYTLLLSLNLYHSSWDQYFLKWEYWSQLWSLAGWVGGTYISIPMTLVSSKLQACTIALAMSYNIYIAHIDFLSFVLHWCSAVRETFLYLFSVNIKLEVYIVLCWSE